MALSTYAELKASVASWLQKTGLSDIDDRAAEFIALAEAQMNRELDVREMTATALYTISEAEMALPCDFAGVRALTINDTQPTPLDYVTPEALDASFRTGRPQRYTVTDQIVFDPTPDGEYEVRLRYRRRLRPLVRSSDCNWLLDKHPDAYLYGALAQGIVYFRDEDRTAIQAGYSSAVEAIRQDDKRTAYPSSLNAKARSLG